MNMKTNNPTPKQFAKYLVEHGQNIKDKDGKLFLVSKKQSLGCAIAYISGIVKESDNEETLNYANKVLEYLKRWDTN